MSAASVLLAGVLRTCSGVRQLLELVMKGHAALTVVMLSVDFQ